jgi:hypothetical protein
MMIMSDPAQWRVAAEVLVRAVVFDGLPVDHPAVSRLLGVLEELADAQAVPPRDILRVGLTMLSKLAQLCQSDSPSILRRAA